MNKYKTSKNLNRILSKLFRKNKKLYENLIKKINEVITSYRIEHYKNLRHDLKDYKRIQVGSFVLIFRYDKTSDLILFVDFDHHDNIYKKKTFENSPKQVKNNRRK
ncbi:MAG: type II toxin-antitoxin system RelE/ParE family toxin [Nanoarchaeota archaeon]|nr:type II toxin-antitoxin system RelE/ParE family toxin [Nanoarchaeota archaeon]MBU1051151.1 type II toxin-antitoxin system RelE/ParE family toxin [Nanoarchaeota archaeon]